MSPAGKKFDYAPAPESRAILDLKPSYGLFIDGQFVDTLDGRSFKTVSPSSEEVLAEITEAGRTVVEAATADLVRARFALAEMPAEDLRALSALLRPVREHAGDF